MKNITQKILIIFAVVAVYFMSDAPAMAQPGEGRRREGDGGGRSQRGEFRTRENAGGGGDRGTGGFPGGGGGFPGGGGGGFRGGPGGGPMFMGGGPPGGGFPGGPGGGGPMFMGGGPPGGGFPGGFPGGGGPMFMGGGGGAMPPEMVDRTVGMIKSMDSNGDGKLDLKEIPEYRRVFVGGMLQRFGVDLSKKPIKIADLEKQLREGKSSSDSGPLVPYFGESDFAEATEPVISFGQKEAETTINGENREEVKKDKSGSPQQIAKELMLKHDKNMTGSLEKSNKEWNGMPFDTKAADKNSDSRLTMSEIISALGGGGSDGGYISPSGLLASSYDRMPDWINDPSVQWYVIADEDKDGQVTMAEFANTPFWKGKPWNENMVAEFESIDTNNDGIITIDECYVFLQKNQELKEQAEEAKRQEEVKNGRAPRGPNNGNDNRQGNPPQADNGAAPQPDPNANGRDNSNGPQNNGEQPPSNAPDQHNPDNRGPEPNQEKRQMNDREVRNENNEYQGNSDNPGAANNTIEYASHQTARTENTEGELKGARPDDTMSNASDEAAPKYNPNYSTGPNQKRQRTYAQPSGGGNRARGGESNRPDGGRQLKEENRKKRN